MTDVDVAAFEAEMWDAARAVDEAKAVVDEAQARLDAARERAAVAMQRYGSALNVTDAVVTQDVVRALYWEHREISSAAIARAFALKGGPAAVHKHAGAAHHDFPCPGGCGRTVRLTARTAPLRPCEVCVAEEKAARERWYAEQDAARAQGIEQRNEWIRQQYRDGRTPEELYVTMVAPWDTNGPMPLLRDLQAEVERDLDDAGQNPF